MPSQVPTILALIALAVLGQALIKLGLTDTGVLGAGGTREILTSLQKIFTSPKIVLGLAFYVVSSFVWLIVLSKVDLSFAFPFVSLTYVAVLLISLFLFDEPLLPNRIIGSLLIIGGVVVVGTR